MKREQWEWDLTNAISKAREANLTDVVVAIQNAIYEINYLKRQANDLKTIKEILLK